MFTLDNKKHWQLPERTMQKVRLLTLTLILLRQKLQQTNVLKLQLLRPKLKFRGLNSLKRKNA